MPEESPPTQSSRPDESNPSRRSFLTSAGTAAATAATGGLGATSGCVELLPPLGQDVRYEDVSPPEAGPPEYREWIPSPEADGEVELQPDMIAVPDNDAPETIGRPFVLGSSFIAPRIDYFGVGIENFDLALSLWGHPADVVVLEGPVAPGEVASTVLESGYVADGTRLGYDRYVREDDPRTVAVSDGRIVFGHGPGRDAAIDLAISTRRGGPTLAETSPGFERVTSAAGTRPFGFVGDPTAGPLDDYSVSWGAVTVDFDSEWFYTCNYHVFEGEVPSRSTAQSAYQDADVGQTADRIDVEHDGQFLAVETRHEHEGLFEATDGPAERPPQITWGVERTAENAVTVRHEAGESVPAESLTVYADWPDARGDEPAAVQFTDEYESVSTGATLEVPIDGFGETPPAPDTPLLIVFEQANSSATLFEYRP